MHKYGAKSSAELEVAKARSHMPNIELIDYSVTNPYVEKDTYTRTDCLSCPNAINTPINTTIGDYKTSDIGNI